MTRTILPDFSSARVLVVGDIMLDRYWHGPTSRISPEAPVPVVKVESREDRLGGAANVALNVAALGARVVLVGLVGEDEAAHTLATRLDEAGVGHRLLPQSGQATITKLRVLSRHQQLIRLDFEDGFASFDDAQLLEAVGQTIEDADVMVLSDYGKGCLRNAPALIELARRAGKPVLVDPKGNDFERYRGATLITPNLSEFEAIVGPCPGEEAIESRGATLRDKLGLDALLVTRSERGMSLLARGQPSIHQPTHAREVFDVTGAGDTVIATLAAALAAGSDLAQAMVLSNLAAGVVVGKLGTATVSRLELQAAMLDHEPLQRGVVEEDRLLTLIERARASGERIVMTNGCFDILHAGHVGYLAEARALGDRLIVAVNDDASVARLKGPTRPVNPLDQRMVVLSALESVDWVLPFSEDTPERLICRLRPDILVKGGDYRPEDIAGGECVTHAGGEVVVLGFVDGCSTTSIINTIRKHP